MIVAVKPETNKEILKKIVEEENDKSSVNGVEFSIKRFDLYQKTINESYSIPDRRYQIRGLSIGGIYLRLAGYDPSNRKGKNLQLSLWTRLDDYLGFYQLLDDLQDG